MDVDAGKYELQKFRGLKEGYRAGLQEIVSLGYKPEDIIHNFPSFVGHLTLARHLSLYEAYKMTLGVAGHIAEVGVFMGAGSLLFAKLTQIFEPTALTLVHGFDWFKCAKPAAEAEAFVKEGEYYEPYDRLCRLIKAQNLEDIVHLHTVDLTKDLGGFFERNPTFRFKLVFVDCGLYDVIRETVAHFWPRLERGGIMVFDHYNHEVAPGETRAVRELLPNERIRTFQHGWMPNAYIVKE